MLFLILEAIINLGKFLIFLIYEFTEISIKIALIILFILILIILKKYIKVATHVGEEVLNFYKIKNIYQWYFTVFMIFLYFNIFVLGVFYLRILNKDVSRDLPEIYNNVVDKILNTSLFINIINITLLLLIIITIIGFLVKLKVVFRRHFIKFHIYNSGLNEQPEWYDKFIQATIHYGYKHIIYLLKFKYMSDFMFFKIIKFPIWYHLHVIIPRLHYICLILLIIYDVVYNAAVITLFYKYLPYIFIYKLYIDFAQIYDRRDRRYNADDVLYLLMYGEILGFITENEVIFANRISSYETTDFSLFVNVYLKHSLNGSLLYKIKENTQQDLGLCYYKDWPSYKNQK